MAIAPRTIFVYLVLIIVLMYLRKSKKIQGKRRLSFTSYNIVAKAFPARVNASDPIINGLFYFSGSTKFTTDMLTPIISKLLSHDNFSAVPRQVANTWVWEPVKPNPVDLIHFHTVSNDDELHQKAQEIISRPLAGSNDPNFPMWEMHVIHNSQGDNGQRAAVIPRIHHVIGDGISLIAVLKEICLDVNGNPIDLPISFERKEKKNFALSLSSIIKSIQCIIIAALLPMTKHDTQTSFNHPDRPQMTFPTDPKLIIFPTLSLDHIKKLKTAKKCTVNDIVMAATCGMIRRYCIMHKDQAVPVNDALVGCRALVPIAFPRPDVTHLCNNWCFVSCSLPVGLSTCDKRIDHIIDTMTDLKNSPMAPAQMMLQKRIMSLLPQFIMRQIVFDAFSRHSLIFSNVPGPQSVITFAGQTLLGFQVLFSNLIHQVLITSYNGGMFMNMVVDGTILPDADCLPRLFVEELKEIGVALGVNENPVKAS